MRKCIDLRGLKGVDRSVKSLRQESDVEKMDGGEEEEEEGTLRLTSSPLCRSIH